MTHTLETLMRQLDLYGGRAYDYALSTEDNATRRSEKCDEARAALQSALFEVLAERDTFQTIMNDQAEEIRTLSAERDTLARNKLIDQDAYVAMRAERDALQSWKQAAEYWYGEYRHMKSGEAEYPVTGALDTWFNGTWKAIAMKGQTHD